MIGFGWSAVNLLKAKLSAGLVNGQSFIGASLRRRPASRMRLNDYRFF
jgi:hypothetical protein